MKTLLIWDWFGEADLALYVIEDAPEWLAKCHKHFINVGDTPEEVEKLLARVNDAICENPDHYGNPDDELAGRWVQFKLNTSEVVDLTGPFQVVISGFA
jgi:hypothetical protein